MARRDPSRRLVLLRGGAVPTARHAGAEVAPPGSARAWLNDRSLLTRLGGAREASLLTPRLETLEQPFLSGLLVWALGRERGLLEDHLGRARQVDLRTLGALAGNLVRDLWRWPGLRRRLEGEVAELEQVLAAPGRTRPSLRPGRPAYLRTDLHFDLLAGGSVGHTAGVLNHLAAAGGGALFLTTDRMPLIGPAVTTRLLPLPDTFQDIRHTARLVLNHSARALAQAELAAWQPSFLYARYSLDSYLPVVLARAAGVPLALEYNGSETWVRRHWDPGGLARAGLSQRIEDVCLRGADLVVVVSQVLGDEVVARGVPPERVLVNPNGVDPAVFSPEVDGAPVRARYGIAPGERVLGFLGTFGLWHGAEVLARAFLDLLRARPELRPRLRLLLVGDGLRLPAVRALLEPVADRVVSTGLVPQREGPAHLAACDLLVSPHVPNPDGSRFFGSPTKLFEYMAMGKGIVASALEQQGELLEHGRTAWLVPPGDAAALQAGLLALLEDPRRAAALGRAAREQAVAHHTWAAHTARILAALAERCR